MLTNRQLEIINGSLLGDGCICTNFIDPNCKFQLTQSTLDNDKVDKISYMSWFSSEFIGLINAIKSIETKGSGLTDPNRLYKKYILTTKANPFWTELEKKWYIPFEHKFFRRKKIIPRDLVLTPLTLCVWMMEDGSNYFKDGNITIETQGFSKEEVDFLIDRLDKDLSIKAKKKKNAGEKDQWRIFIGVESFKKTIEIIKPHVQWECFQYKLNTNYNKTHQSGENHSQSKINEVQAREMIALRNAGATVAILAEKI